MEKTNIIKFNGTKIGVTTNQYTNEHLDIEVAVNGEGLKIEYWRCRFCNNWTTNPDKICKHCFEALKDYSKEKINTLNKFDQPQEQRQRTQKTAFAHSGIQPEIYVEKLEAIKQNYLQPTKEQATILIQLIKDGCNTNEMLATKLKIKPISIQRYLQPLCNENIVLRVKPRKSRHYYIIPETTTIKELD